MASFSNQFSNTQLAARIPTVWTPIVEEEFFPSTVAAQHFLDLSEFAREGGDSFKVADLYTNAFTVQTQSTQGAQVNLGNPAQVTKTVSVDTHKYVAALAGDKDIAQLMKSFSFNEEYAKKMSGAVANALEESLFGLWSSFTTNLITDSSAALTDLQVRQAIEKLEEQKLPDSEWVNVGFFFHPHVFWNQALGIQKYYQSYNLGKMGPVAGGVERRNGLRGSLYEIPVYVSTNVVSNLGGYRLLLAHKHAIGYALQTPGGDKVRVQSDYLLQNVGLLIVADIIYGVAVVREPVGVVITVSTSATTNA